MESMELRYGLMCTNPEVDDDVTMKSFMSRLALANILDLLGGNTSSSRTSRSI
jgi:hypothetical protein